MNKRLKNIITCLFVVLLLVAAMVACTPSGDGGSVGGGNTGGNNNNNETPKPEAAEYQQKITNGFLGANEYLKIPERFVESSYSLLLSGVNVQIDYEANYSKERKEDSEILLRIYNKTESKNASFFHYKNGDLFYDIAGERRASLGFSSSALFSIFYDTITLFDLGTVLFLPPDFFENTDDFVDETTDLAIDSLSFYLNQIVLLASLDKRSTLGSATANGKETIRIQNVGLETIKDPINKALKAYISDGVGGRFDALTRAFLGFDLSTLGNVGIGVLHVKNAEIALDTEGKTSNFTLELDGMQDDNLHAFGLGISYRVDAGRRSIVSTDAENPDKKGAYETTLSGEMHYKGQLTVDLLGEVFDAEVKAKLSATDSATNQFLFDVRSRSEGLTEGEAHYRNKQLVSIYHNYNEDLLTYVDIKGLIDDYLHQFIRLSDIGFPRVKMGGGDLSKEINTLLLMLYDQLDQIHAAYNQIPNLGSMSPAERVMVRQAVANLILGMQGTLDSPLLDNFSSSGTKFEVKIDKPLLSALLGEENENALMNFVSSFLAIDKEVIGAILGTGVIDNLYATVCYDFATGAVALSLFNGSSRILKLELYRQTIEGELVVAPHEEFVQSDYKDLAESEAMRLHLEGDITMQGQESVDVSELLGLFVGDSTGKNSPLLMNVSDFFYVSADTWKVGQIHFFDVSLWRNPVFLSNDKRADNIDQNSLPLVRVYTSRQNPEELLIELLDAKLDSEKIANKTNTPVLYRTSRAQFMKEAEALLGDNHLFAQESYGEIFNILSKDATVTLAEEWLETRIAPKTEANGRVTDPLYELLGVKNLTFVAKLQVHFFLEDYKGQPDDRYQLPEIEALDDIDVQSIYQLTWRDTVKVLFGDTEVSYALTFRDESATLQTGKNRYTPTAWILGKEVTYGVVINDTVNGTQLIKELKDATLEIDPSKATPIPTTIKVVYDNGKEGEQPFQIVGFMTNAEVRDRLTGYYGFHEIIIGEGSIAEYRKPAYPIRVLNRDIQPEKEGDFDGQAPVVATVTIDPYAYSQHKLKDAQYDPLSAVRSVNLKFGEDRALEETCQFDWEFDENNINFGGGIYYVKQSYNALTVSLKVVIISKVIDYIQINDEERGIYTIDALVEDTYHMPTVTDQQNEVRIYFKPLQDASEERHYRIVGGASHDTGNYPIEQSDETRAKYGPLFDGYYNVNGFRLVWEYASANKLLVTVDGVTNPFSTASKLTTNQNTTVFGDAVSGRQSSVVTVRCPSRRVGSEQNAEYAYTNITILESGEVAPGSVRDTVFASSMGFGSLTNVETNVDGAKHIVNPYGNREDNRLPQTITLKMEYGSKTVRRAYPVTWEATTFSDEEGYILNTSKDELLVRVVGNIGTAVQVINGVETEINRQKVYLLVSMTSGKYTECQMVDPKTGDLIVAENGQHYLDVDPYDEVLLPTEFTLVFHKTKESSGEVEIVKNTYDAVWEIQNGEEWVPFDRTLIQFEQGLYPVRTVVPRDEAAQLYAQVVYLYLRINVDYTVQKGYVYGVLPAMDNQNYTEERVDDVLQPVVRVQGLLADSFALYERILASSNIGVQYQSRKSQNNIPVVWTNANEVLALLRSPSGTSGLENNRVTLRGKIYQGSEKLEQEVNLNLRIENYDLSAVSYGALAKSLQDDGILRITTQIATEEGGSNSIHLRLEKPYALVNALSQLPLLDDQVYLDSLITLLLDHVLAGITFGFENSALNGIYVANYVLPANIDKTTFAFQSGGGTNSTFMISKVGEGSTVMPFAVTLETAYDAPTESTIQYKVEVFGENGNPRLADNEKEPLPVSLTIRFSASGSVRFEGLTYFAAQAYVGKTIKLDETEEQEEEDKLVNNIADGEKVKSIGPNFFFDYDNAATPFKGRQLRFETSVMTFSFILEVHFLSKNINNIFAATAEDARYNIADGKLHMQNAYEYYPFDPTKLPTTITPKESYDDSGYKTQEGKPIQFSGTWIPKPEFADDNDKSAFDQDKINAKINSSLSAEGVVLAYMVLPMYLGTTQTVELTITGNPISATEFGYGDTDNLPIVDGVLTLDPYRLKEFLGNFTLLHHDLTVLFNGGVSHVFTAADNLTFAIKDKNGEYHTMTTLPYSHLGHFLGTDYGTPTDQLDMRITLPDGKTATLTVKVLERIAAYVEAPNAGEKDGDGTTQQVWISNTLYIDPYREETHTVPTALRVYFESDGTPLVLGDLVWTYPDGAPFVDGVLDFSNALFSSDQTYTLTAKLTGYGSTVEEQTLTLTVIVVARKLITNKLDAWTIENGLTFSQRLLDENTAISVGMLPSPPLVTGLSWKLPRIVWKTTAATFQNVTTTHNLEGQLLVEGESGILGETVKIAITVYRAEFESLLREGGTNGRPLNEGILDFSSLNMRAASTSYLVRFRLVNSDNTFYKEIEEEYFAYYGDPADAAHETYVAWEGAEKLREHRIIQFGTRVYVENASATPSPFTIGSLANPGTMETVNGYHYRFVQTSIDQLDFEFGEGYQPSGSVVLVIDPFHPVIPTKVLAKGRDIAMPEQEIDFGYVGLVWKPQSDVSPHEVFDVLMNGGVKKGLTVYVSQSKSGKEMPFIVDVVYLNRTPQAVYATEQGYTGERNSGTAEDPRYLLLKRENEASIAASTFRIDPINESLHIADPAGGRGHYQLPSTLVYQFVPSYSWTAENARYNDAIAAALQKFGAEAIATMVEWEFPKDQQGNPLEITLAGTGDMRMVMTPKAYSVGQETMKFDQSTLAGQAISIGLSVMNRTVVRTSISKEEFTKGGKSFQAVDPGQFEEGSDYQNYLPYIDPFNISLPSRITVYFTNDGGTIGRNFSNFKWVYDEEQITDLEVVTGTVESEDAKFLMCGIPVVGTTIDIRYPIRPRVVNPSDETGSAIMNGGRLYVMMGAKTGIREKESEDDPTYYNIEAVLPSELYYKYETPGVGAEVVRTPLKFTESSLRRIATDKPQVYENVEAVLGVTGRGGDPNIRFVVEVVSPKVFQLLTQYDQGGEVVQNSGFHYDEIVVAVSQDNRYRAGQEVNVLPARVQVGVSERLLNVVNVRYDIANKLAIFEANYDFLDVDGDNRLFSSADGETREQTIFFTVPLNPYNYQSLLSGEEYALTAKTIVHPLGEELKTSALPLLKGATSNKEIAVLWEVGEINVYAAGSYTLRGHYINASNQARVVTATVVINKKDIGEDAYFALSNDFLRHNYTGKVVEIREHINLTIQPFIQANGELSTTVPYVIYYSVDGGLSWIKNQPTQAGTHLVRFEMLEHQNYVGVSQPISFTISPKQVDLGDIVFVNERMGGEITGDAVSYEYDGSPQVITHRGLDVDDTFVYQIRYYQITHMQGDTEVGEYIDTAPVNAGTYRIFFETPSDDKQNPNYTVIKVNTPKLYIYITKRNVVYQIPSTVVYSGIAQTEVPVNNLPATEAERTYAGVKATFAFYDYLGNPLETMKDVGTYRVVVTIDGGVNYPTPETPIQQEVRIIPRKVTMRFDTQTSEYLDPLVAFNNGMRIYDEDGTEFVLGADDLRLFLDSFAFFGKDSLGAALTAFHLPNQGYASTHDDAKGYRVGATPIKALQNYTVSVEEGLYQIVVERRNSEYVQNKEELDAKLAALKEQAGSAVGGRKFVLAPGNYGSITINFDAAISLVGAYNTQTWAYAVTFDSVTVLSGGVSLDIIEMRAQTISDNKPGVNLYIGKNAGEISVNRTRFYHNNTTPLSSSIAIFAEKGFQRGISVTASTFSFYHVAIHLEEGRLELTDSTITESYIGVQIEKSDKLVFINNRFVRMHSVALYLLTPRAESGEYAINYNTFDGNRIAIKSNILFDVFTLETVNTFLTNNATLYEDLTGVGV